MARGRLNPSTACRAQARSLAPKPSVVLVFRRSRHDKRLAVSMHDGEAAVSAFQLVKTPYEFLIGATGKEVILWDPL